ncbi:MAG: DUF5317 domain-containing protein [Tissierellaceae bacterium]
MSFLGVFTLMIGTLLLAFLTGKIRGGKLHNLSNLYIDKWYLFALSFLIQISSLLLAARTSGQLSNFIIREFSFIHILIYLLFITALLFNWQERGFRIILLGSILNFLPIFLNGGRMPVSIRALRFSGLYTQLSLLDEGRILTHTLAGESSRLFLLCDIIPLPEPLSKVISLGDIFISAGIFYLIQFKMREKNT